MGLVYEVKDQTAGSEKTCALKVLTQKIASEEAFLQFKQEFWFMTKLRHPNIIQVHEYGVLPDGRPYITMELVPGQELTEVRRPDIETIYNIFIQATKALGFIHSRRLVHCDIKPENLRLMPNGHLKLMDFGLMRPLGNRSNGQLSGTVAYMPPEMPQRGIIDESSDFYSLGVVMYELITGIQPFIGKTILEVVKAHIHNQPPAIQSLRPDIPPALADLVHKLMAKTQAERYTNAEELLIALAAASNRPEILESADEKQSYLNSHVLVGRDTELQLLKDCLEQVRQNHNQTVLIGAPAGVGKSRLIEEFKIHSQLAEIPFCEGMCVAQGMASYEPLVKAFGKVLPLTPPELLAETGPVLAYLLPQLTTQGIEKKPGFDAKAERILLFETILHWLRGVAAQQPLVIFVDDLHWADLATIDLFNYCTRGLQDTALFLVGSFRDDELLPTNPLWQTVDEKAATLLKLNPFNPEQVAELVEKMLVHVAIQPEFIQYFYGATSGNAFFVTELLRYLLEENLIRRQGRQWVIPDDFQQWELPTSIGDTVKQRLKRLSQLALPLIQVAAVVGRRIPLKLLQALGGLPDDTLFLTLEELVERQFLVREEPFFVFPHDRVRETLYGALSEETRRPMHQKIGEFLERQDETPATLAYHFKNGVDTHKAIFYLFKAGEMSSVRMESAHLIKAGLDLLAQQPDYPNQAEQLRVYRSKAAWISYMIDPWVCIDCCEKLIDAMHLAIVPFEETVEFESILISSYTMVGKNEKALEKARYILRLLEPGTLPYGLILFGRLNALLTRGELRQLIHEMEEAAAILQPHLDTLSNQLVWAYAFCCFIREDAVAWLGEPVGGNKYAAAPQQIGTSHHFLDLIFWSYYPEVVRNSLIGRYQAIKEVQDEIMTMIKKMGRPIQHENRFNICLAFAAIEHGEMVEGQILSEKIVALGQRMKNPHQQANGEILLGMIAHAQKAWEKAETHLIEAVELGRKSKTDQLLPALYRLAQTQIEQGQWQKADPLIEEAHALATSRNLDNPYHQIHTFRLKGHQAAHQQQNENKTLLYFLQSLDLAERTQNTLQLGFSHRDLGVYLGTQNRLAQAIEHLEKASQSLALIGHPDVKNVQAVLEQHRKRMQQAQPVPAITASVAETDSSPTSPVAPDQAKVLGYKLLQVMQDMNLMPLLHSEQHPEEVDNLWQRLEKVEKVNQFSQLIMKNLDLQQALVNILDYVIDIAQADRGFLMLLDEQGELSSQVTRSANGESLNENNVNKFSQSFTKKVRETRQSLWVKDAQSDEEFSQQQSIMALDLRTIICVPLIKDDEMIGLLYLDRQSISSTFTANDLELVESMAAFATISLVNARLHQTVQERSERLQMLNDLSRKLSTTVEFSELLTMLLTFCMTITQAEIGYIFLSDKMGQEQPTQFEDLQCQASQDHEGQALTEVTVSRSIIQRVLTTKEPLCVVDTHNDAELSMQQSIMALDLRSVICVPLQGKQQECLGVMYVSSQAVNYCFTQRDLALMESIVRQVGLTIENRHLMEIRKRQELVDKELSLARNIQTSMLPDYIPDISTLDIIGFSQSAAEVGGDYYDYFKISDNEFGMAIGDVNGHGVSAGLLMAMAKSCLFVQGKVDPGVVPVMTALNGMIFGGTKERLFMTFIYSIFDLQAQTVTMSSAGHHLPYFYQAATGQLQPIKLKSSYPLGVRETAKFNEATIELKPHDILVYYTDGFIEAHNLDGEEFGFERFENLIVSHAHMDSQMLKEVLLQHYRDWMGNQEDEDDITLVVVKVRPIATEEPPEQRKLKTGFLTLINR